MKEELIKKSWSDPSSEIVGDMLKVSAEYMVANMCPMNKLTVNSVLWYSVITNRQVRLVSDKDDVRFPLYANWEMKDGKGGLYCQIAGLPFILIKVTDDVDLVEGTLKKCVEDNTAIFGTDALEEAGLPDVEWPVKVVF